MQCFTIISREIATSSDSFRSLAYWPTYSYVTKTLRISLFHLLLIPEANLKPHPCISRLSCHHFFAFSSQAWSTELETSNSSPIFERAIGSTCRTPVRRSTSSILFITNLTRPHSTGVAYASPSTGSNDLLAAIDSDSIPVNHLWLDIVHFSSSQPLK